MAGHSAFGTVLTYFDVIWRTIGELTNIGGPALSAETLDLTTHDSWRHYPALGTCTFDGATNVITATAHGLNNGQTIRFSTTGAVPAEVSLNRWFFIVNRAANTFQIALTPGGAVVDFTGTGTGVHSYHHALAYRAYASNLLDGGEVTLEGNLTTALAANVLTGMVDARVERDFRITFPTGVIWSLFGIVTAFETSAPHDDKLSFTASIKVNRKPTLS